MPFDSCQVHAGVIDTEGNLTPGATKKFIDDVKEILAFGSANATSTALFPCGPEVPGNKFFEMLELDDQEKFPDFHKNILGLYRDIAQKMDAKSNLSLLPICCPVSLGYKLGVDIKLQFPGEFAPFLIPNLPGLALKLDIMPPPKLAAKIPNILGAPPPIPSFDLDLPEYPKFFTLKDFMFAFTLAMPEFMMSLVTKMPELALKLPNLPSLFNTICQTAFDSKIFGDIKPESTVQAVATKVLTRKVVEMSFIVAVGVTLGSSPNGITGGLGKFLGYQPPEDDKQFDESEYIRNKIADYALACAGMKWSDTSDEDVDKDDYVTRLMYTESQSNIGKTEDQKDPRAIGYVWARDKCKDMSSCGLLVRAALFAGGASCTFTYKGNLELARVNTKAAKNTNTRLYYDFFSDEYRTIGSFGGIAIAAIIQAARIKNAFITVEKEIVLELPALKKGDVIITYNPQIAGKEHAILVAKDYEPGGTLTTVEGGQTDVNNDKKPTMIKKKLWSFGTKPAKFADIEKKFFLDVNAPYDVIISGRKILCIIDGEKICKNKTGSSWSLPAATIDSSIASDNNDPNDHGQYLKSIGS